jgi:phospholipid/cholesterol/gamma-HCH transport system substrate-binding protein
MAIHEKARWARLKVGVMAIVALFILGVLIFLLTANYSPFTTKAKLYTFMEDSAAVAESSPVTLNGIVVGKVEKIGLSGLPDATKIIRMDLEVEAKYLSAIPVDSLTTPAAANLLGAKYINIKKGVAKETVKNGDTLAAIPTKDFDEIIAQGNTLLVQLQSILKRVDAIVSVVEQGKGSIGKLLVDEELYKRILATVAEVQSLSRALNSNQGTLGKLVYDDALYNDVRGTIARLDRVIDDVNSGQGTAGKLLKDPAMYDNMNKAILDIRKLLADLDAGKGTAGKLLKSEELHNQIAATLGKVDSIIDKMNSGQGTIGQLLVNQSLYDSLNGTSREINQLMKDFRANPKKFLTIQLKLF